MRGVQVTVESMVTDLVLMKAMHFNAVRCSHYPNSPVFYELCSRCASSAGVRPHMCSRLCGAGVMGVPPAACVS